MTNPSSSTENQTIVINKDLVIELLPIVEGHNSPALCLHTRHEPEQSIVILLNEIHQVRDALAEAGTRLKEMRLETIEKSKKSRPDCSNLGPSTTC